MKLLTAIAALLLAGCSKEPNPAPYADGPKPAPEPSVPLEDLRFVLRGIFEVRPKADRTTGHDLIAFVGPKDDLESLTEAHLSKEGPRKVPPLYSRDDLHLFLLWGPRIDGLPKDRLEVDRHKDKIRVNAQWVYAAFEGMPAPAQIPYVGYGVRIGRLRPGRYEIVVDENGRNPDGPMRRTGPIAFEVLEGSGPPGPEPPPVAGKEPPRVTCQSGCCVGMHTFKLGIKCIECRKTPIADGHNYCSTCAQKLRRCVHCGQAWK